MFSDYKCALCRASKLLCGKDRCPIMVKFESQIKFKQAIGSEKINGSTPPDIFIGRYGYPNVYIGPLVTPEHGDTGIFGTPEMWMGKTIDDIVDFRSMLVRGKHRVNVKKPGTEKIVESTQEIALAGKSAEVDVEFFNKPAGRVSFSEESQPYGPSARVKNISIGTLKTEQRIEKAHSDTDLKAAEAVTRLYRKDILVSKIQKAFSAGLFGVGKNRVLVPTRYSITAVDDIISKNILKNVKQSPIINEYRIYELNEFDNRWIILMIPSCWSYELIEAWYPKTTWNPFGAQISIFSDYEGFNGRSEYPEIGGCYFASRLAVSELLEDEKRQAAVIVMRESHPGYIMPLGVWLVRESVRKALKTTPSKFADLKSALGYVSLKFDIKIGTWIKNSAVLRSVMQQRTIGSFVK